MASQPTMRRMHYTKSGDVKKSLSPPAAARIRSKGWRTYSCWCGKVHASRS